AQRGEAIGNRAPLRRLQHLQHGGDGERRRAGDPGREGARGGHELIGGGGPGDGPPGRPPRRRPPAPRQPPGPRHPPARAASGPPVSSGPRAPARGSRRGGRSPPPASGIMPSPVSGRRNSACSAATTRSAASTSSKPPPAAIPLTAAITGFARACSWVSPAKPPGPWSASTASPAAAALRSQPAQKNRPPAAVTIPTRRPGSLSRRANASYSAWLVA